jgi:hypothetical protein
MARAFSLVVSKIGAVAEHIAARARLVAVAVNEVVRAGRISGANLFVGESGRKHQHGAPASRRSTCVRQAEHASFIEPAALNRTLAP